MRRNHQSAFILVILLLVGLVIGGLIGDLLAAYVPTLDLSRTVGFSTTNLNVGAITISLGLSIDINPGAAIGIIIAILLYRQM